MQPVLAHAIPTMPGSQLYLCRRRGCRRSIRIRLVQDQNHPVPLAFGVHLQQDLSAVVRGSVLQCQLEMQAGFLLVQDDRHGHLHLRPQPCLLYDGRIHLGSIRMMVRSGRLVRGPAQSHTVLSTLPSQKNVKTSLQTAGLLEVLLRHQMQETFALECPVGEHVAQCNGDSNLLAPVSTLRCSPLHVDQYRTHQIGALDSILHSSELRSLIQEMRVLGLL